MQQTVDVYLLKVVKFAAYRQIEEILLKVFLSGKMPTIGIHLSWALVVPNLAPIAY